MLGYLYKNSESPHDDEGEGEGEFVLFHGIIYLGASKIEDPRNEELVRDSMSELGKDDTVGMSVTLSIPTTADGVLKLLGNIAFSKPVHQTILRTWIAFRYCIISSIQNSTVRNSSSAAGLVCFHGEQ